MKKIIAISIVFMLFMSINFTNVVYAKSQNENRYPLPIKSTYYTVTGKLDKYSNIFNNKEKQKIYKSFIRHFRTTTYSDGTYLFEPKDDGFHGSRGLQWVVCADFNKNFIQLGLLATTFTTRLQGPIGMKSLQIKTPYGVSLFNYLTSSTDFDYSTGYAESCLIMPISLTMDRQLSKILTNMLRSEERQIYWFIDGIYGDVDNSFSIADIRGMRDAVELFEILIK